ncbi:hypothetical protein NQ318_009692 [Aromia moschata]|uniref:Uncharacterized protein n=1 Tax=Aromia moschata TaxID=1265417 RepID=A0AAV8Y0T7_9CUCU|nr:hypothetical protein NQ318_009692 [Aromia moschata]
MRGSSVGLPENFQGYNSRYYTLLTLLDSLFAAFVLCPCVVGYWRSVWRLMDIYVAPHDHLFSALVSTAIGFFGHMVFSVFQKVFVRNFHPEKSRILFYIVSRSYTVCFAFICVNGWRGPWMLLDFYTKAVFSTVLATTLVGVVALISIRALRNVSAPPCLIVNDDVKGYFEVATMFRTTSYFINTNHNFQMGDKTLLYILDCLFSVLIVGTLVVFVWRGAWALMDLFVFPEDEVLSAWGSLGIWQQDPTSVSWLPVVVAITRVNRVRPDISKSWELHHNNAPSHTCFLVADYLVKAGITLVPQPPYSPDHFGSVKNIQKACTDALKAIPENDYRAAFDAWKTRWNRSVDAGGMSPIITMTDARDKSSIVVMGTGSAKLGNGRIYQEEQSKITTVLRILGYASVAIAFILQPVMKYLCDRFSGAPRLLIADFFIMFALFGTVNVWRGIWNLLNIYFLPEHPELSCWITHWVCLIVLILLGCANSLLVRGVYIDAEEPAGKMRRLPLLLPQNYLPRGEDEAAESDQPQFRTARSDTQTRYREGNRQQPHHECHHYKQYHRVGIIQR